MFFMRTLITLGIVFCASAALAQKPQTVSLDHLLAAMQKESDRLLVFNFWATWCGPCVKELPLFEKLNSEQADRVEVTLVSMDLDLDPSPDKVYRFVDRKKLKSTVWLLDASNPDSWISRVDKEWSGALPATIIINPKTGQRKFIGKALDEGDLERLLSEME